MSDGMGFFGQATFSSSEGHITILSVVELLARSILFGGSTMFDRLFIRPTALRRHCTGPLLKERLDYLAFLAEQGQSVKSLQFAASYLLVVTDYLRLTDCPGKTIRREEIEQKAARWAKRRSSKLARWCGGSTSRASFLWRATD